MAETSKQECSDCGVPTNCNEFSRRCVTCTRIVDLEKRIEELEKKTRHL